MITRPELQADDPITLFHNWLQEAEKSEPNDPNAAALATASKTCAPSVRMVLVKGADTSGFTFYTNSTSQKGQELESNPQAALCFHWKSLRRQVRVQGHVQQVDAHLADQYFHSRSRRSQIGAAVSKQSRPLISRALLEDEVARFAEELDGQEVPRPSFWRGYLVTPTRIEFWIDGSDRLHDRMLFTRSGDTWAKELLYP